MDHLLGVLEAAASSGGYPVPISGGDFHYAVCHALLILLARDDEDARKALERAQAALEGF